MKYAVQVVLLNEDKQVLAVSRKDDHYDFGLVGGKVDPEDKGLEEAMIRECKEETGLDITNFVLIHSMHIYGYMQHTYLADWEGTIFTTENHIVKWADWEVINNGTFGEYNKWVGMSLKDMGVEIRVAPPFADTQPKANQSIKNIKQEDYVIERYDSKEELLTKYGEGKKIGYGIRSAHIGYANDTSFFWFDGETTPFAYYPLGSKDAVSIKTYKIQKGYEFHIRKDLIKK